MLLFTDSNLLCVGAENNDASRRLCEECIGEGLVERGLPPARDGLPVERPTHIVQRERLRVHAKDG